MGMACVKVYNMFLYIKGNLLVTPSQVRERVDFEEAHPAIGNPDEDQIQAGLAQQPPLLFPNPIFQRRYMQTDHLGMVKVPPNYSKDLPNSGYGGKKLPPVLQTPQSVPKNAFRVMTKAMAKTEVPSKKIRTKAQRMSRTYKEKQMKKCRSAIATIVSRLGNIQQDLIEIQYPILAQVHRDQLNRSMIRATNALTTAAEQFRNGSHLLRDINTIRDNSDSEEESSVNSDS